MLIILGKANSHPPSPTLPYSTPGNSLHKFQELRENKNDSQE